MKKVLNGIFVGLGFFFLGLGAIGVVLPLLPATPFLLLSAFMFAKGSDRFHKWFMSTKLYQKHLEPVVKKKEMTGGAKVKVILMITALLLIGFFIAPIWHAKVLIIAVWVIHILFFMLKIKTVKPEEELLEG